MVDTEPMTCLGVGAKDSITAAEKTKTKAADKGREEPQPLIVLLAFFYPIAISLLL